MEGAGGCAPQADVPQMCFKGSAGPVTPPPSRGCTGAAGGSWAPLGVSEERSHTGVNRDPLSCQSAEIH